MNTICKKYQFVTVSRTLAKFPVSYRKILRIFAALYK